MNQSVTGSHGKISFDSEKLTAKIEHGISLPLRMSLSQLEYASKMNKGEYSAAISQIASFKIHKQPAPWGWAFKVLFTSGKGFWLRFDPKDMEKFRDFENQLLTLVAEKTHTTSNLVDLSEMKVCPQCAEDVKKAALICRYCSTPFA